MESPASEVDDWGRSSFLCKRYFYIQGYLVIKFVNIHTYLTKNARERGEGHESNGFT